MPALDYTLLLIAAISIVAFLISRAYGTAPTVPARSLELGTLIDSVRTELVRSERDRINSGQAGLFAVKTFDLELNFVVRENTDANVKAGFYVLDVGAGTGIAKEMVQKIVLHMETIPQADTIKGAMVMTKGTSSTESGTSGKR